MAPDKFLKLVAKADAEAAALELLTGSRTARVVVDGAHLARVRVLDQLAERNSVHNGGDVRLYDSSDRAGEAAAPFARTATCDTSSTDGPL